MYWVTLDASKGGPKGLILFMFTYSYSSLKSSSKYG